MVVFLANRDNIRLKRLHRRILNRLQSDGRFTDVQLRVAETRERGPYRVVARTNPRSFLGDETYPVTETRIQIGFEAQGHVDHEFYWWNWIEPGRNFLLGWHQDDDHPEDGPVHVQVSDESRVIARQPARFIDEHPMAVVEARLEQVPEALDAVEWQDGNVTGIWR